MAGNTGLGWSCFQKPDGPGAGTGPPAARAFARHKAASDALNPIAQRAPKADHPFRQRLLRPVAWLMLGAFAVCGTGGETHAQGQDRAHHGMRMGGINRNDLSNALVVAVQKKNAKIAEMLLKRGASPDATGNLEKSALMIAACSGDIGLVNLLLEHGADVNLKNGDGDTALMLAVKKDDPGIVNRLLKAGADANAKNKARLSPLTIASENNNKRIITLLVRHGAEFGEGTRYAMFMSEARDERQGEIDGFRAVGADKKDRGETALKRAFGDRLVGGKMAQELHEKLGIEEFDRFTPDILGRMHANLDKSRENGKPILLDVTARSDHNGAFYRISGWPFFLDHYKVFIVEAENAEEVRARTEYIARTYGKIAAMIIEGHGEKERILLGYEGEKRFLTQSDEKAIAQLKPHLADKPTILLDSCSSGEDGGSVAATISRALDATVLAPAAPAALKGYLVNGDTGELIGAEFEDYRTEAGGAGSTKFEVKTNKFVSGKLME